MWYSVLIGDEEADSVSWSAVATVAVVCLAVLGTLWGSLVLVARAFGAVTEMCAGVVRSLLGQDARGDDGVQFEEQIGSSGGLFETLPGWQYGVGTLRGRLCRRIAVGVPIWGVRSEESAGSYAHEVHPAGSARLVGAAYWP